MFPASTTIHMHSHAYTYIAANGRPFENSKIDFRNKLNCTLLLQEIRDTYANRQWVAETITIQVL